MTDILEIIKNPDRVELILSRENGKKVYLRITSSKANVWRLQSSDVKGGFEDLGAVQLLKEEFNEPSNENILPLDVKEKSDTSFQIESAVNSTSIQINLSPFHILFLDKTGKTKCTIDDISFDEAFTVNDPDAPFSAFTMTRHIPLKAFL